MFFQKRYCKKCVNVELSRQKHDQFCPKLLLLWLQFLELCPRLWCWILFSRSWVLVSGRSTRITKYAAKQKATGPIIEHKAEKTWNERLEFPLLVMQWPQLLIKQTRWHKLKLLQQNPGKPLWTCTTAINCLANSWFWLHGSAWPARGHRPRVACSKRYCHRRKCHWHLGHGYIYII